MKQQTAYCESIRIKELYLWKAFPKISTFDCLRKAFGRDYGMEMGGCVGFCLVTEEMGIIARYESREDAEDSLEATARQAARGELVVFDDDFYLIPYPPNEFNYGE